TTTRSDIFLPEYEAFYDDHVKEISSGSTTTYSDSSLYDSFIFDLSINLFPPADRNDGYIDELAHIISPPVYNCFYFKNEPNSGDFNMDVVENIFPSKEPGVQDHNVLPTHPPFQLNLDFILSSESLFAYVVWIFLPFLSYSVAPQYLLSFGNEVPFLIPASAVIISLLLCRITKNDSVKLEVKAKQGLFGNPKSSYVQFVSFSLACFRDEFDNVVKEEDGEWICFLGGNNSSGTKKCWGSNSGDGGIIGDGVKIVGEVIGSCGGIGEMASEAKRYLDKLSERSGEMLPGEAVV
nr:hypothetical protein [Tanacetum cinerariifolium]